MFSPQSHKRIVVNIKDSQKFARAVMALMNLNKQVIILPNHTPGTLAELKGEYDYIFSDSDFGLLTLFPTVHEISEDSEIVFFTSGSNGQFKKVLKKFKHLKNEVYELQKQFGDLIADATIVATVSHQHIYGFLFKLLWPLMTNKNFLAETIEYPEQLEQVSKSLKNYVVVSSPAFLKRFYNPEFNSSQCLAIFSSGGFLPAETAQAIRANFGVLPVEVYGSTETGGIGFRKSADQLWQRFSPVSFTQMDDGRVAVTSSYFAEDRLVLSDQLEIYPDGFKLLGRSDDIVKIEEKRVSLSEVNSKIKGTGWIKDSVVVAIEQFGRQQTAGVLVLSEAGQNLLEQFGKHEFIKKLRTNLLDHFEPSVIPRKYRFIEELPYNEQSKLERKKIERMFLET